MKLAIFDLRSGQRLTPPGISSAVIGKSRNCEVPLQDDHCSRRHCKIEAAAEGILVEDLGSANGTWIRIKNGAIVIRKMMNLSSSFDHRVVDGYDAAAFIQRVKGMLEHPAALFIEH